jgi:hypothetical protein
MPGVKDQLQEAVSRVEAVFIPGRLRDKRDDMRRLLETGDALLFDGDVRWSVMLMEHDKRLDGESESMGAAFGDMAACLSFLAAGHGDDALVMCAVRPLHPGTAEAH